MHLFNPHHVKLLNSCYPPSSVLPTAGPDYSPNSHELSRLTYYASNHPGKLAKIGSDLEKRLKAECYKAKTGNVRSRASLLISLAIFRALAMECRRDIALLSPSLIASVDCTLASVHSDLEVTARAASVFTAWTTYTNGQLIGTDSSLTKNYLSILSHFAGLSSTNTSDQETQNRTRLIGLAAITAALHSEALHNDIGHFGAQVSTILRPILTILFVTPISTLEERSFIVKEVPDSPYLAEFRTRPAVERRAASIHVHIDGDNGPSALEVSDACLRAFYSLLGHANGAQLGFVMQSSFDNLDSIQAWSKPAHCCWYAQKAAEWAQYQYRYVVPTWLVEHLSSQQDTPDVPAVLKSLIAMVTSVFSSPVPLINLSSSDILSNLLSLLLRRISLSPVDDVLPPLVECISSLGRHVYYSDQIQDLAGELIGRLIVIEIQGISVKDQAMVSHSRSSAIRCILRAIVGLFRAAQTNDLTNLLVVGRKRTTLDHNKSIKTSFDLPRREREDERSSRRTRVPADIWQDTLSLLCDGDPIVRTECATALINYITEEMPKYGESTDTEGKSHLRKLASGSFRHVSSRFTHIGDSATRFLNSVHAYIYVLAISPTLGLTEATTSSVSTIGDTNVQSDGDPATDNETVADIQIHPSSPSPHGTKALKKSLALKLVATVPSHYSHSVKATEEDYASLLKTLSAIHVQFPMRGIITGVPMLITLDNASMTGERESVVLQRIIALKTVIAHVWLVIGQVWKISQLVALAEQNIESLSALPKPGSASFDSSLPFKPTSREALTILASAQNVQDALGMDRDGIFLRLSIPWSPELALRDFETTSGLESAFRADSMSPLLKISPALMHIENISLQSLARSTRGLGVTDLREALEGRSMSNPNLVRPPSISTLDQTSSVLTGDFGLRLTRTMSKKRAKKRSALHGTGEVRDVLMRLGIGKQNSNDLATI